MRVRALPCTGAPHRSGAPSAGDTGRSAHQDPPPTLRRDERGQLFVLTGILLVLGFVVIGTTLVQLNAFEDKTTRAQREPLMETVDSLISSFQTGIRGGVELGNTNITQFKDISAGHVLRFKDAATRVGLYADVELYDHPALQTYLTEAKCGGYDLLMSKDGVIIGYEEDTMSESIVGAIYYINIVDGRQSVKVDYYVKIFDCLLRDIDTFPESITSNQGSVIGLTDLRDQADNGAAVTVKEQLTGTVYVDGSFVARNLVSKDFTTPSGLIADGTALATHPPTAADDDYVRFNLTVSQSQLKGKVFSDLKATVQAFHLRGPLVNDDTLQLQMREYGTGTVLRTWDFAGLDLLEKTFEFDIGLSPSGNAAWTYDEFRNTTWDIRVIEGGSGKDAGRFIYIDWAYIEARYVTPERHTLDVEFDWPVIPSVYGDHELNVWYKRTAGTPSEDFQIQLWNTATGAWEDAGSPFAVTGAFTHWSHTLTADQYNDGQPLIRLVDSDDTDNLDTDMDVLEFDFFGVASTFQQP